MPGWVHCYFKSHGMVNSKLSAQLWQLCSVGFLQQAPIMEEISRYWQMGADTVSLKRTVTSLRQHQWLHHRARLGTAAKMVVHQRKLFKKKSKMLHCSLQSKGKRNSPVYNKTRMVAVVLQAHIPSQMVEEAVVGQIYCESKQPWKKSLVGAGEKCEGEERKCYGLSATLVPHHFALLQSGA